MPFPSVDTISINGVPAPGQWILQATQKVFGWQVQQGYALSGATVAPKGDELVVAPFLVKLWRPQDFDSFRLFRSRFLKKAVFSVGGQASYALGIVHPELAELGVTSVVVAKAPVMTNNGKGLWSGTCEFLQYRKPAPAPAKPNAAIPGHAVPKPVAKTEQQRILEERRQTLHNLRPDDG